MRGSFRRIALRPANLRYALILALWAFAAPGLAQDKPSLKDILGRAQSDSERKAVEDLIGKLQGKPAQPVQAVPEAAKAPAASGSNPQAETSGKIDVVSEKSETTTAAPITREQPAAATGEDERAAAARLSPEQTSVGITLKPGSPGDGAASAMRASSEAPAQVQSEPLKAPDKPAADVADRVVEQAERKQLPSVDLEVLFEFNSASLTPAAIEMLTTLGRALIDPRLSDSPFLIGGHTDAKGDSAYNLRLSQRRAETVREFLIATFAIDASRLEAKGFGTRHLKNARSPRAAENRRVQVVNVSR